MKIVEQTSTRFILQDSAQMLWMARVVSAICFIWSIGNLLRGIFIPSTLSFLIVFHIVFSFIFGMIWTFFFCKNTVCFDKNLQKITLISESALQTKAVEYSLDDIMDVKAEVKLDPEGSSYNIILTLLSKLERIHLSHTNFISAENARETTKLLRGFLNLSE